MLRSMTGFGGASHATDELVATVEVRSVNNRFLKVITRLPESHASLETRVEKRVREVFGRGTVSVWIRLSFPKGSQNYRLNADVVRGYMEQLRGLTSDTSSLMGSVLALPGCVDESVDRFDIESDWPVIEAALESAMKSMQTMCRLEGEAMHLELRRYCQSMLGRVEQVSDRVPRGLELYRDRLLQRVNDLLANQGVQAQPTDIIREVALFAERSDIAEEVTRLKSHLLQFQSLMDDPDPCGRKLDFLTQEMHRECNTMGAKSGDVEISRIVVELKSEVDRMREMVANVE